MTLVDTADSVLMNSAYGWAFVKPIRKLWYNLTLTFVSVVVALFIGGLEALSLVCDRLGLNNGAWMVIHELNAQLDKLGYIVVGFHCKLGLLGSGLSPSTL
jgi:high-affinity nickel-transport protein